MKDIKIEELAKYLDISEDEIEQTYDENHYETYDGEEYIVCDYDTALDLVSEDIRNQWRDLGLESIPSHYHDFIFENCVDQYWFNDAMREFVDNEYDDKGDEEIVEEAIDELLIDEDDIIENAKEQGLIDEDDEYASIYDIDDLSEVTDIEYLRSKLKENYYSDDPIEWYMDYFGEEDFKKVVIDNDLIDEDKVVEIMTRETKLAGEIGIVLAVYDSNEIDLGHDLFAYRVN